MKEKERLENANWKKWGPYISNRQWGTVREDYSDNGDAWQYTTYEMGLSKSWRWGEDAIAGISDHKQILCFAPGFWNGKDPFIKERFFGLNNIEGNHGEDIKEIFYYLDNTPTHSYMKMVYKYPHAAFPYEALRKENKRRTKNDPEFELIDTGIFDQDNYFDIFIEYAKNDTEDILIKITACNRSKENSAPLTILPTVWFRNRWDWGNYHAVPEIFAHKEKQISLKHNRLGDWAFYYEKDYKLLFCNNSTNNEKLYGVSNENKYVKDGINEYVVNGNVNSIDPSETGTKAAILIQEEIAPNESVTIRLRLSKGQMEQPFDDFESIFQTRINEANDFYSYLQRHIEDPEEKLIQRQAFAGMLWNKQFYKYNVARWLDGDPGRAVPSEGHKNSRNTHWRNIDNQDIISMPDKWEFPWYAAWDLAFHCVSLALVDLEFAKEQLELLTKEWYMHPNGQLPAYEWNFSDTNPPVHAWATWEVYQIEAAQHNGVGDNTFLESIFHKLLFNFTWWVNRKDSQGSNIFSGGFLGLDNIGVFDRSMKMPEGVVFEQADGTSWMAMYALNMMRISLELAESNIVYSHLATKFFEHFLYIAGALMNVIGDKDTGLWDEADEFFYDQIKGANNETIVLRLRSLVGLIPLFAVSVLKDETLKAIPDFENRMNWFLNHRPDLAKLVSRWDDVGSDKKHLLSLLRGHRTKRLLARMLDPKEFLSDYGVRSMSKIYQENPYTIDIMNMEMKVAYTPGESNDDIFGGNSNWRGPIWMPMNYMIIESLFFLHDYYSDDFKVECPTGSGNMLTLKEIAINLGGRLIDIFKKDKYGNRPCIGENQKLQRDPYFENLISFNEYFNGDNGKGLGASHQTGWTGLVTNLIYLKGFIQKGKKIIQ